MKTQCLKWQPVTMLFENEAVRHIFVWRLSAFYWEGVHENVREIENVAFEDIYEAE